MGGVSPRGFLPRQVSTTGGVYLGKGVSARVCVCLPGGCLPREGVSAQEGCTVPPLCAKFLTHACENITFPRLRTATIWSFVIQ